MKRVARTGMAKSGPSPKPVRAELVEAPSFFCDVERKDGASTSSARTVHITARWSILLLPLVLASCATPETRLRTGLVDAGLAQPVAACMADRMVDRLSLLQLRRIGSLASLRDENLGTIGLDRFLRKVRALKDAEILAVTTSSAALCAFR